MNNTVDIKKQAVNYNKARGALLSVVALTFINVMLIILQVDLHFYISAITPSVLMIWFPGVVSTVLAFVIIALYGLFWWLSKKYRVFTLVALIVFALDTLVLFGLMLLAFDTFFLISLAFHGYVWYSLILGIIAWAKLSNVTPEEAQAAVDAIEQETANAEAKSTLETMAPAENQDNQTEKDDRYEYYGSSDENNNNENN